MKAEKKRTLYKGLRADGRSPNFDFYWPLPQGDKPGEWVEMSGNPAVGVRGFHVASEPRLTIGELVYEVEIGGEVARRLGSIAAQRARLIRLVEDTRLCPPVGPVEMGLRPCLTCGEPHGAYRIRKYLAPQWGHPDDGHPYRAEPWETFARRLLEEKGAAA